MNSDAITAILPMLPRVPLDLELGVLLLLETTANPSNCSNQQLNSDPHSNGRHYDGHSSSRPVNFCILRYLRIPRPINFPRLRPLTGKEIDRDMYWKDIAVWHLNCIAFDQRSYWKRSVREKKGTRTCKLHRNSRDDHAYPETNTEQTQSTPAIQTPYQSHTPNNMLSGAHDAA
jgi:hypothetical protein